MLKYLLNGEEVEAVQQLDDSRWLVYRILVEEKKRRFLIIVNEVFDHPPKEILQQDISKKYQELERLCQAVDEAKKALLSDCKE